MALIGLLALWLALLTGCSPLVVDAGHDPSLVSGSSYLSQVLVDGKVMRWTRSDVTVSIDTANTPTGWKPIYEDYVVAGLEQWQDNSGGALRFRRVDFDADISVRWVYQISGAEDYATGRTEIALLNGSFLPPTIELAMAVGGQVISDSEIRATAIHELGHAIGLFGHSPNPQDVMYASSTAVRLSAGDIATLLDLYSRPAEISEADSDVAKVRDAKVIWIYSGGR